VGAQYDFNYVFPCWYFLGKIASRALFEDDSLLEIMNSVHVRNREFVGFMNITHNVTTDQMQPVKEVEVDIKRPRPGEPVQMFWKPARGLITQKIKDCKY